MDCEYLYKYQKIFDCLREENQYTKRLFLYKELHVLPATDMNDPFECLTNYLDELKTDDEFRNLYDRLLKAQRPDLTSNQRKELINEFLSLHRAHSIEKLIDMFKAEQSQKFRDKGVICLSSEPDNILMWSHYADGHKGYCLKFNTRSVFSKARKIIYPPKPPDIDIFTTSEDDWFTACLMHKFEMWKYENEYRLVVNHSKCIYRLNEGDLTGVILGCKMSDFHRNKIIEWLKTWTRHIEIYEAIPQKGEYAVKIERYNRRA